MHNFCCTFFSNNIINKKMKFYFLIVLFFSVFSLSAQPRISFDKTQHDFGKVNEDGGTASHDFTFTNTGNAPLIIQNVVTTCGCTTPEYTRQPIRPGESGFIKVSYDVKGRPGAIDKTITVHANSNPSQTNLRIVGEVIPIDRHPSEAFRHPMGAIRMSDVHVSFNKMYTYEKPTLVVRAYNPGAEPVKVSFVNLPAHINAQVRPATIRQGETAEIRVTYDAARKNDWGFVADQISMILNDNKATDYKMTVTANIEEDFSRWTTAQLQNAPSISLDRQVIEAGKVRKGEKNTYQVKITNSGKSKLIVRKIDTGGGQLVTVNAPKEINAGATADLSITFDSSGQSGELSRNITLIANDPRNSQVTLRLRAEVTE